jgi:hypothetical protein
MFNQVASMSTRKRRIFTRLVLPTIPPLPHLDHKHSPLLNLPHPRHPIISARFAAIAFASLSSFAFTLQSSILTSENL